MQQDHDDDLISLRKAAKALGLSHSILSRQIKRGQIRTHGGKVRLAEVRADRARNLRRGGRYKPPPADYLFDDRFDRWCLALEGWPARVAPLLAAEFNVDPDKLAGRINYHVVMFLAELCPDEGEAP